MDDDEMLTDDTSTVAQDTISEPVAPATSIDEPSANLGDSEAPMEAPGADPGVTDIALTNPSSGYSYSVTEDGRFVLHSPEGAELHGRTPDGRHIMRHRDGPLHADGPAGKESLAISGRPSGNTSRTSLGRRLPARGRTCGHTAKPAVCGWLRIPPCTCSAMPAGYS